jgi:ribonuclease HII
VTRDRSIKKLSKKYGEIGSGYPSDPVTVTWLAGYIEEHSVPPPIARGSWKTVRALLAEKSQTRLADF